MCIYIITISFQEGVRFLELSCIVLIPNLLLCYAMSTREDVKNAALGCLNIHVCRTPYSKLFR